MTLIDRYLPRYQFHEHHSRPLAATPARAMAAVQAYRPEQDPFFRCAIALRELPVRAFNQLRARPTPTRPPFGLDDFTLLDRDGDRELAYGLIGRFWRAGYDLIPCADGPAFLACQDSGAARLVINFAIAPQPDGQLLLSTETRVYCPDRASLLRFAPYWALIRPVSGWIRRRMLAGIAQDAQARLQD